jgi:hypothetical protein
MRCNASRLFFLVLVLAPALVAATAAADPWKQGGYLKYMATASYYGADNILSGGNAFNALDQNVDFRYKLEKRDGRWDVKLHYQFTSQYGDTVAAARPLIASLPLAAAYGVPSDRTRLFDLTAGVANSGKLIAVQRLDRASFGYAGDHLVFRFGRDAISWGNGMVFQPMDIFNPFSPTAVDKEYKTGDDMLYLQYLFSNGDDLQTIAVPRRDATTGALESTQSSLAMKYHGRRGQLDFDLLAAEHYDEQLAGFGGALGWHGAVVRGDAVINQGPTGTTVSAVANINSSWVWGKHNTTGFLEYYRNGFGQGNGDYSSAALAANTELLARIARGEVFTLGRDYLAGGLTVEWTPRTNITQTLIANLDDYSTLYQGTVTFDWQENLTVLTGLVLPFGPQNTEYGGVPTGVVGQYYRPAPSAYLRLAWYF